MLFFILALAGIATLLFFDAVRQLQWTSIHQQAGSLSLMLIGASYICLQLSAKRPWNEMLKGILLGTAFLLWGGEQFLPAGHLVTGMDSAVITIFVIDLGLIILEHLNRKDHEMP